MVEICTLLLFREALSGKTPAYVKCHFCLPSGKSALIKLSAALLPIFLFPASAKSGGLVSFQTSQKRLIYNLARSLLPCSILATKIGLFIKKNFSISSPRLTAYSVYTVIHT